MTSQEAEIVNLPGVERKRALAIVDRTAWGKVLAEYIFTSDDGSIHSAPGSARSIALDFIDRCNSHSKRLNPSLDTLAGELHLARSSIVAGIRWMVDHEFLIRTSGRGRSSTHYELTFPPGRSRPTSRSTSNSVVDRKDTRSRLERHPLWADQSVSNTSNTSNTSAAGARAGCGPASPDAGIDPFPVNLLRADCGGRAEERLRQMEAAYGKADVDSAAVACSPGAPQGFYKRMVDWLDAKRREGV
jgi:hypothetical protein